MRGGLVEAASDAVLLMPCVLVYRNLPATTCAPPRPAQIL